jgi:hypothetical protein
VVALKLPPLAAWFKRSRPESAPGEAPPSP